jgi:hypothetical protein
MSPSEVTALRAELDKYLASLPQTPLQKQQYILQKEFLDRPDVPDVEIIMVPHVFATNPPGEKTSYIAFVSAIQVSSSFVFSH